MTSPTSSQREDPRESKKRATLGAGLGKKREMLASLPPLTAHRSGLNAVAGQENAKGQKTQTGQNKQTAVGTKKNRETGQNQKRQTGQKKTAPGTKPKNNSFRVLFLFVSPFCFPCFSLFFPCFSLLFFIVFLFCFSLFFHVFLCCFSLFFLFCFSLFFFCFSFAFLSCHTCTTLVFSHSRTLSHDVLHSPLVSRKRSYFARRTQSRNTANMVAERR